VAVTFDSEFEKGSGGSAAASPFSYVSNAGTTAGAVGDNANRLLIATVVFFTSKSNVVVTWDQTGTPQTMTQIGSAFVNANISLEQVYLFGLLGPTVGAKTIQVSWTGGNERMLLGAVSVFNADQTTGWQNFAVATGSSTASSLDITTASGDLAIAGHDCNNPSSTVINVGTSDWIDTASAGNGAMARNPAVGATTTISWTQGSSKEWAVLGVDVIQAAAASTVDPAFSAVIYRSRMREW
jgi:hypothetical protein